MRCDDIPNDSESVAESARRSNCRLTIRLFTRGAVLCEYLLHSVRVYREHQTTMCNPGRCLSGAEAALFVLWVIRRSPSVHSVL